MLQTPAGTFFQAKVSEYQCFFSTFAVNLTAANVLPALFSHEGLHPINGWEGEMAFPFIST